MGAAADTLKVPGDRRGRQAGFDMIEVQVFEQLESDGLENVSVLQHGHRIPTSAPRQYR